MDVQCHNESVNDTTYKIKILTLEKDKEIKDKEIQNLKLEYEILKIESEKKILKLENEKTILKLENKTTILKLGYESKISKLENEKRILKVTSNDVEEDATPEKEKKKEQTDATETKASVNDIFISTNDLISKGISKFFLREEPQTVFYNTYRDWFEAIATRMKRNSPFVFEKSVLVKVKCIDPTKSYNFYSGKHNRYNEDQSTDLDILMKGWTLDTALVSVLHPDKINKCLEMNESMKDQNWHSWYVDSIPDEYIGTDGFFIILGLKHQMHQS